MAYSLKYSFNSSTNSYSVIGYENITLSDIVVIPDTYNGPNGIHPVTSIGDDAFRGCGSLTSITIPDSVTSIGKRAFYGCSSLTSITIPNSVTSIGTAAFADCSNLTSVTISNSVASIVPYAFQNCGNLMSIIIPDSVTSIGDNAFYGCSKLKKLILFPSTPPTLGSNAISSTISKIYVQQSSKSAYQADTNWKTFASKIVSDNIYLSFVRFNQKNKEYIDKKINDNWNEFNLENGTGTGSLAQKRLKSDGVTWTTAKAYQGASTAFGGGTQAGRTETEFNNYFWDSTKNVPLNGGAGKNASGEILDNHSLTYKDSYSFSVAEGEQTKALGRGSHSEGYSTKTEGEYSHVEGWKTVSRGLGSHAEGEQTTASGDFSHAEGFGTSSKGAASHSEGMSTEAIGDKSHAEGFATRALEKYQHVEGVYNADNPNALHIVGNGTSENARKNAFVVLKDGRAKVQTAPKDNDDVVRKADLANIGGGKLHKHDITKTIDGVKITLRLFDSKSISLTANEIIVKHKGNNTAFVDEINNTNYIGGGGILNAIIPTSKYGNITFEGVLYGAHKSNGEVPYAYIYDSQDLSTFLTGASYTITEL